MLLAGVKVVDTSLVRETVELARSSSEPYLFNHVMRSWLFGVLIAERSTTTPDHEILAVSVILHDLGLTDRYAGEFRFEVDGANAARSFLKDRGISAEQIQLVWDAIALHTTPSLALHKEPEVAAACAGIALDVVATGLDQIRQDEMRAILTQFPRLAFKRQFLDCLCSVVRRKPTTTYDNVLRDVGMRYVEGYTAPSTAELLANAPFAE